jgi:uncharacterized protein (DUF433 family)
VPFETRQPVISNIFIPFRLFVRMLASGGVSEQELRRECPDLTCRDLQTLIAYARGLPTDLEKRFHLLMHDSYWVFGNFSKAATGKGYWSHYQLRAVRNYGGLTAVKRYLTKPQAQEGFDRVLELNMVEFSIEALVLRPPWSNLSTPKELDIARARLAAVGYNPASPTNQT